MLNLPQLPFQGDIFPDESFMGFVLRMSNRNGILGIYWLLKLLGRERTNHFLPEDIPAVAYVFGADPHTLTRRFALQERVDGEVNHDIHGHRISKPYLVRPLRPQLCPYCLVDSGYSKAFWDFSLGCSCPTHGCLLLEACPLCFRAIKWTRQHLLYCNCGTPWREFQTFVPRASHAALSLASLLQAQTGGGLRKDEADGIRVLQLLAPLSLDVLLRLIWAFGARDHSASQIRPGKSRAGFRVEQAARCIDNAVGRLEVCTASSGPHWSPAQVVSEIHLPALHQLSRDISALPDLQFIGSLVQLLGTSTSSKRAGVPQGVLF